MFSKFYKKVQTLYYAQLRELYHNLQCIILRRYFTRF